MSQSKKDIIRSAAIEVISKQGFHHATSDKIAAKAGISVGTIYYYFDNKEEILAYIFKTEYEKRLEEIKVLKKSTMHPLQKIKRMIEYHFQHVMEDDKVARIIIKEKHLPFIIEGGIRSFGGIPRFLEETIQEGILQGQIRKCNSEVVAIGIFGIIEGVISRFILEKEEKKESDILEKALGEIDELLWKGLQFTG